MSHVLRIADITVGGFGTNNPVPLTITNYDLSEDELKNKFYQVNVIAFHTTIGVNLQVTGLVLVNPTTDQPMMEQNDPVYLPCPPFCYLLRK